MYFQKEYLRNAASMTLNSTYQLDLPKNGLLGSLLLYIFGNDVTGLGATGGRYRICDYITKIEIIADGAKVLKSITGKQAQALAFFSNKCEAPDMVRNYAANTQTGYFLLDFGRFLLDRNYGLDLSQYKSVELKITNDATASQFASLSCTSTMFLLRDAGATQFKGLIKSELWRDWVPVAGATQYLDLPSNMILRKIVLQPQPGINASTGKWYDTLSNLMYELELNFKTGADRVYKDSFFQLMVLNAMEMGKMPTVGAMLYNNADYAAEIGLGYHQIVVGGASSKDAGGASTVPTLESDTSSNLPSPETSEADHPINVIARGLGYQQAAQFAFDVDPDPSTWINTREKDVIQLNIGTRSTATVTSCKNNVILETLETY